jgi:single-stranded DNA-specific DHH superfamily exonuclease
MLTQKQLDEIKEKLESSQNPLFFFDNDVDGLCSFLIMQRAIGRGKGVSIKSFPGLSESYIKKVEELNPDCVFILDKPLVDKEFLQKLEEKNIPITWIDHHEVELDKDLINLADYYNSYPSTEPTTYLAYKAVGKKEDMFLAMIGCIGDVYMPEFSREFSEKYPELFNSKIKVFDSLYLTEIGKASRLLNFALKDSTTNVVNMLRYLMKIKDVYDIMHENKQNKEFHLRANQLTKIYDKHIEKAENNLTDEKLLVYTYSGDTAMSSELANGIYFKHKNKFIVVAFRKQDKLNASIRGKSAKKILAKIIKKMPFVTGGGHEEACGAQIPTELFEEFVRRVRDEIEN